jgi:L-lactate utilization protein LutB
VADISDEQYWREKAQELHQELASTQVLVEKAEELAERRLELIAQKDETIKQLSVEITRLGVEINAARSAAANAVKDYIGEMSNG